MDIALGGNVSPFDIEFINGDLQMDSSLQTAVTLSLFTDRRAAAEELPPGETSRKGWWADSFSLEDDRIGSRLWLLDRSKPTGETLAKAREYAEEALAWLVEDGLVERIEVSASYQNRNLALEVKVHNGENSSRFSYMLNWRGGN